MAVLGRRSIVQVVVIAALAACGAVALPTTAEAQARGTLQASATVVDTRQGFTALEAARTALRQPATDIADGGRGTVATVAQVTVTRPSAQRTVVVTIAYSRN